MKTTFAIVGVRGDLRVRNVYNKATSPIKPAARSIDQAYEVGDVIHVQITKKASGWYSTVTVKGTNAEITIMYTKIELIGDINTEVRFGLAFFKVSAVITNLKCEAEDGTILYGQTSCYEVIGTLPVAAEIEEVTGSDDRSSIFVKWAEGRWKGNMANIVITEKSSNTVYMPLAPVTGIVDQAGTINFEVNGEVQ
ncbi:MAG: hypothetical protein E7256_05540 [Lachnospiraceae bacterium]|nr:hypothetical protein [Lachnospiraceae bacterium]